MADLLSHVLIAYVALTVASWRLEWLTRRWVAVGMVGAVFPDLDRLGTFVSSGLVQDALGLPFSWGAIHTLGGVLLLSGFAATTFPRDRLGAFGVLTAGGLIHLLTDAVKIYADGRAAAWLYPFTTYRHPTPNLYVSADAWVLGLTLAATVAVFWVDRRRSDERYETAADQRQAAEPETDHPERDRLDDPHERADRRVADDRARDKGEEGCNGRDAG